MVEQDNLPNTHTYAHTHTHTHRLGELATRWWNEITYQTLEFARQVKIAAV
jgi:hypothetical protein